MSKKTVSMILFAVVLIVAACVSPSIPPSPTPFTQPESPLVPENLLTVLEKRWRLVEITLNSEMVDFSAIAPSYIFSNAPSYLSLSTHECNGGFFPIVAKENNTYQLGEAASTYMKCSTIRETQFGQVMTAIGATTTYTFQGKQLLLLGENVQIVLELESP